MRSFRQVFLFGALLLVAGSCSKGTTANNESPAPSAVRRDFRSSVAHMDCFPQYALNGCNPRVSLAGSIYLSSPPSVFIEKYMTGATVGVFSADCTGSLDTTLECVNPDDPNTRFIAKRVGNTVAATFNGDPAAPDLFMCRR